MKRSINLVSCVVIFGLLLREAPLLVYADPGCDILIYANISEPPVRQRDTRDTCPEGNGPRAYLLNTPQNIGRGRPGSGEVSPRPQLKEVGPDANQHFKCLRGQKCYIVVKGFGLMHLDALAILPLGQSTCPPTNEVLNSDASDMPVFVQSEHTTSLASTRLPTPLASFSAFEIPDNVSLANGTRVVCYAPALASEAKSNEDLQNSNFHQFAGILEIGDSLLFCDFEEDLVPQDLQQGDLADSILPCGFKNFRDRWQANLIWELGIGETETLATGPHGDVTPSMNGKGHYVYMDSPGYALGAAATLVSPPVAYPAGGYCAQFSYSMYGTDVSTLRAYVNEIKLSPSKERAIQNAATDTDMNVLGNWGSPRWVAVGNKGDVWHKGGFEFKATPMQTYQLVFEALAGRSEYGDIAIDDVKITQGRCPSEVLHHMPKTLGQSNQPLVCGEVRLNTGEHSADKSWYVDGAVSCAGRGYSLDNLNNTSWLPCCVPHFGTYKLVLEDHFGDGWSGSYLEFRFFDRVLTFGKDGFQQGGFDKTYNLVIGSLEVTDVQKPEDNRLSVNVRVARPGSFAWCGVVQAGKTGKPLKADLTPDLLKKYGVRSPEASKTANEIINIEIRNVLKKNSAYDLYCYSEVIGDKIEGELEQFKQEIAASRTRISTDREAPQLSDISVVGTFHSANVTFTIDEPSSVWCVGIHVTDKGRNDVLFGPSGPLEGISESTRSGDIQRMLHYFQTSGEGIDVAIDGGFGERPIRKTIVVSALIPDSDYNIYCYAEDHAEPEPNRMTADQVNATMQSIRTQAKIPTVRIARRQTLHRGFRLFVTGDAPGRAWCAAAPTDYGVPDVSEILGVGAMAEIKNPGKEVPIDVRGVEPNTAYIVYCIGGNSEETAAESGGLHEYSSSDEMIANSVSLVSYGRYCEEGEGPEIVKTVQEFTPFHPVTAEEEMRVRNYVMGRSELGLEGVYRITLLPNKTEIKDFYMGRGPKPLRYARVRAGRCVNDAGLYEQFRVGPLNGDRPMSYERVAQPIETECGGYNPQGVFGRRLMDFEDWEAGTHKLSNWFKKTFGYEFGTENCRSEIEPLNKEEALIGSSSLRYPHSHDRECLEPGPVMIQEVCDETEEGVPCPSDSRGGRIWVGLKTPTGDQLPFYFIYELPETSVHSEKPPHKETAEEWVRRIIRNKELPDGFHEYWEVKEFWVNGQIFKSINEFLAAAEDGRIGQIDPKAIQERRRLETGKMFEEAKKERRQLQPHPYAGAAGTAGPLPSRQTRRGGLEYRAHPEHIESQGKRFQAEASSDDEEFTITFAGWNMTVNNDRDTGLRVYHVSFQGQSVAFEMGLMEALAHYSVSERNWFFLDSWYGGLGAAARKVHKGIECPKTAMSLFWDGSLCVFEQDNARPQRSHWKSGEIRDAAPQTTLVLRQMLTVSNYDYVTDYRFHMTGIFEGTISFTGELYAGIEVPWYSARQSDYGVQVTGAMRFAALHSHMAVWKVDLDVGPGDDWKKNSVYLMEVIPDPARPGANTLKKSFAETERDAIYFRNDTRALVYHVVDEKIRIFGNIGGWRVIAFPGINPLHHDFELYSGPAAWAKYRVFSTVRKYGEMDSTLPRDNKYAKRPATSVDRYLADNEPLRNSDVVTWIADGIFHVPVIEDMPQTVPVGNTLGWMIKPANLFFEDPSMDLSNAMGGGVDDPGTCAVVRVAIEEVEPALEGIWTRPGAPPVRDS